MHLSQHGPPPFASDAERGGVGGERLHAQGLARDRARGIARDHPGFDKVVVLGISPQWLDGRLIGTVDTTGTLGVAGPMHPDLCNDYIAAVVRADPDRFIGFASVNPLYRGTGEAVAELERAVVELGLSGVKLYPMYQHWAANDPEVAFPIYAKAQELGIPVMIHQAGSTRIDAKLELGRPALLDDVGREFRDLRVIVAHCGWPWVDEALFLLTKHPNFYAELSYLIASLTRRDLFLLLTDASRCSFPSRSSSSAPTIQGSCTTPSN